MTIRWLSVKKGKGSPYFITEHRVPELIPVPDSQPKGDMIINPAVGCHYFPPGLQLPLQPLRGLLPILLLGEQRHNGCEQFAKTVTQQRHSCDLNPGTVAPESNTLTTRLPSNPCMYINKTQYRHTTVRIRRKICEPKSTQQHSDTADIHVPPTMPMICHQGNRAH